MQLLFYIYILAFATMVMAEEKNLASLLHNGNNKLTAQMFTEIAKDNPKKSFVMSAYSIMTPLAQLGLASVEDAHDELLDAIGMPDDVTTKAVFSLTTKRLRSVKGITLKTASKIYVAKNYALNEEFAADTRDTFESEVQNINFLDSENAANEVNTWVEEQTNKRIKNLVSPDILTPDTKALLVNAIYFKGLWENQFDKLLTRERQFHISKNKESTVSMMNRKGKYKYADSDELKSQIIEIPYKGDESSLVIVLPKEIEDIDEVQKILEDPNGLDNALNNMHKREVELYLPQFKIETTTDLKDVLIKMNIKKMFSADKAKLYRLIKNTQDLYIDSAKQKAFIEVNEEGAEAAAANVFGIAFSSSALLPPPVIYFEADHPFLFFLREGDNTLFSGVYYGD